MGFYAALKGFGEVHRGDKIITVTLTPRFKAEIYLATLTTWAGLVLIRTGSAAHNRMMCDLAKRKGMKLHADGSGLFRVLPPSSEVLVLAPAVDEVLIPCATECDIFHELGVTWKEPKERE